MLIPHVKPQASSTWRCFQSKSWNWRLRTLAPKGQGRKVADCLSYRLKYSSVYLAPKLFNAKDGNKQWLTAVLSSVDPWFTKHRWKKNRSHNLLAFVSINQHMLWTTRELSYKHFCYLYSNTIIPMSQSPH